MRRSTRAGIGAGTAAAIAVGAVCFVAPSAQALGLGLAPVLGGVGAVLDTALQPVVSATPTPTGTPTPTPTGTGTTTPAPTSTSTPTTTPTPTPSASSGGTLSSGLGGVGAGLDGLVNGLTGGSSPSPSPTPTTAPSSTAPSSTPTTTAPSTPAPTTPSTGSGGVVPDLLGSVVGTVDALLGSGTPSPAPTTAPSTSTGASTGTGTSTGTGGTTGAGLGGTVADTLTGVGGVLDGTLTGAGTVVDGALSGTGHVLAGTATGVGTAAGGAAGSTTPLPPITTPTVPAPTLPTTAPADPAPVTVPSTVPSTPSASTAPAAPSSAGGATGGGTSDASSAAPAPAPAPAPAGSASPTGPALTGIAVTSSVGTLYPARDGYRDEVVFQLRGATADGAPQAASGTATLTFGSRAVLMWPITSTSQAFAWNGWTGARITPGRYVLRVSVTGASGATLTASTDVDVSPKKLTAATETVKSIATSGTRRTTASTKAALAAGRVALSVKTTATGVKGKQYLVLRHGAKRIRILVRNGTHATKAVTLPKSFTTFTVSHTWKKGTVHLKAAAYRYRYSTLR